MHANTLSDSELAAVAGIALVLVPVILAVWVVQLIAQWKTVNKMGGRGWSQVVPVYASWELARSAGCEKMKCVVYTAGLVLLPVVFVGILGFGQAMPDGTDAEGPRIMPGPSK